MTERTRFTHYEVWRADSLGQSGYTGDSTCATEAEAQKRLAELKKERPKCRAGVKRIVRNIR